MKIIFIRHGDPDYENDSLTEKGIREAKLLAKRVAKWDNITQFYCSPLGRAKKTASYSLDAVGREAVTYEWLKEFSYKIDDPVTGRHGVPWDLMPRYWTEIPEMYDREAWKTTELYRSNDALVPAYREVCEGLDGLLSSYGYKRHNNYYLTDLNREGEVSSPTSRAGCVPQSSNVSCTPLRINKKTEDTIVIFCHLGVTCIMLSHLLNISPVLLLHGFYLAPTSVTVLTSEERMENDAAFRVQVMGDVTHLLQGKEPVSKSGLFADPFQG